MILHAIRRPIAVCMLTLIVVVVGIISMSRLPMTLMPEMASTDVTVITRFSGASPEVVEDRVTRPLENTLKAIGGLVEMQSISQSGMSRISLRFSLNSDVEKAQQEVTELVSQSLKFLPRDVSPPRVRRFDPNAEAMMLVGISSDMDSMLLSNMVEDHLRTPMERLEGVAGVELYGESHQDVEILLDRDKLQAAGLTAAGVSGSIAKANGAIQGGKIEYAGKVLNISVPSRLDSIDTLRKLIVAQVNGVDLQLQDVASVELLRKKPQWRTFINGKRGLRLEVMKNSDANTVKLSKELRTLVEKAKFHLPQAELLILEDSSVYIKSAINNVSSSIYYGGFLAVIVLLTFLRAWQSTLVIAISIPVSIISTFIPLYIGEYTLNVMTLGGLALGIGMLVDNAIVVLENIIVHRDRGENMETSSHKGSSTVFFALIASTATTLIVFLPLLLMRGLLGLFFNELAVVVGFSLLVSLVSAILIVPTLARRLIPEKETQHGWLYLSLENTFLWIERKYLECLRGCMTRKWGFLFLVLLALLSSFTTLSHVPQELMPSSDPGKINLRVECPSSYTVEEVEETIISISAKVRDLAPEVISITSFFGENNPKRVIGSRMALVPSTERERSTLDIVAALKVALADEVALKIRVSPGRDPLTPRAAKAKPRVYMNILGWDLIKAEQYGKDICDHLSDIEGIAEAELAAAVGQTEKSFIIDRFRAESMGLSVSDLSRSLKSLLSGERGGTFLYEGKELPIQIKFSDQQYIALEEVLSETTSNRKGDLIAYKSVMEVGERQSVSSIKRMNGLRITAVQIDTESRDPEDIVSDIEKMIAIHPPTPGLSVEVGGSYIEDKRSTREMMTMIAMAILLVYMVMAAQFESLLSPLKVLLSIPLAIIGVLWALFLTGSSLNVQSYMGMVLLAGIVVNNAILLITTMGDLRGKGMNHWDSALEAGRLRLRPILMTALTTILGLLPLALGLGEGAEAQAPLARVVIGGLLTSTIITTLIIPVLSVIGKDQSEEGIVA